MGQKPELFTSLGTRAFLCCLRMTHQNKLQISSILNLVSVSSSDHVLGNLEVLAGRRMASLAVSKLIKQWTAKWLWYAFEDIGLLFSSTFLLIFIHCVWLEPEYAFVFG